MTEKENAIYEFEKMATWCDRYTTEELQAINYARKMLHSEEQTVKKANNREELEKRLSAPMKETLNILKENDMHGIVSICIKPDTDYIFFFCSDTGNKNISNFEYFEGNESEMVMPEDWWNKAYKEESEE